MASLIHFILEIAKLTWKSDEFQEQESPIEFNYLGKSRIVTKASLTFPVTQY